MGIERAFDGRLTDDKMRSEPLVLSIDSRVQGALESELYAGMVAHRAKGGTGLVLDANTGEVIAMASLPVFNPNKLIKGNRDARRNNVTLRSEEHTSELQSLMRNSYAVFCLKKKKNYQNTIDSIKRIQYTAARHVTHNVS